MPKRKTRTKHEGQQAQLKALAAKRQEEEGHNHRKPPHWKESEGEGPGMFVCTVKGCAAKRRFPVSTGGALTEEERLRRIVEPAATLKVVGKNGKKQERKQKQAEAGDAGQDDALLLAAVATLAEQGKATTFNAVQREFGQTWPRFHAARDRCVEAGLVAVGGDARRHKSVELTVAGRERLNGRQEVKAA